MCFVLTNLADKSDQTSLTSKILTKKVKDFTHTQKLVAMDWRSVDHLQSLACGGKMNESFQENVSLVGSI